MKCRISVGLITLSVLLASSCRTSTKNPSEALLLSTDTAATDENANIERLYYKHDLSSLKTVIEYAPDYDSKIILTVDVEAQANAALIKSYMNNSKGFERTITFDLISGKLTRLESQLGNKDQIEVDPPKINSETESRYVEIFAQLLDQVSAIREGRNNKNSQHLELNSLVSYLENVMEEIKPMNLDDKASRAEDVQTEFTGSDAQSFMSALEKLGFSSEANDMGYPSISLDKIECSRGQMNPRLDPAILTSCSVKKGLKNKSAGSASDEIYELLTRNGVSEHQFPNKKAIRITSLRCVEYTVTHGTTKCFFVPGIFK